EKGPVSYSARSQKSRQRASYWLDFIQPPFYGNPIDTVPCFFKKFNTLRGGERAGKIPAGTVPVLGRNTSVKLRCRFVTVAGKPLLEIIFSLKASESGVPCLAVNSASRNRRICSVASFGIC